NGSEFLNHHLWRYFARRREPVQVHPLAAVSQERQCARGAKELDPCALPAGLRSTGKCAAVRTDQRSVSRRLGAVSQSLLSFNETGGKAPRRCATDQALRRAKNSLPAAVSKRRARQAKAPGASATARRAQSLRA